MGFGVRSPNKSRWISLAPLVPASLAGWWPILSWWKCGYSHPLCSNVWFLIPDFSCQPVDHGAQEGWRLWNLPSQEGQINSEARGGVSRLSKAEEQTGTQSRWALGVRLDSSSGVLVQHSHFSGGDTEVQRREEACPRHTRHPRNRTLDSASKTQ